MKKISLSLVALAITFASIAQSQHKKEFGKEGKEKHQKEFRQKGADFGEKLNLTEAQKSQVKAQNEAFKKDMEALKASTATEEQKKQQRKDLLQKRREQMQAILTPEQKEKAKELRQQAKAKHDGKGKFEGRKHGGEKGKGAEKFHQELGLTADQSAKLKQVNQSFRTSLQDVRKNESLTEDQKKEQVKSLQQKHKEEIRSLLTTEQQDKLKDRVKNRPNRRAVK
jgi:Spy/CpxP family protein refolding chaperone